MQTRAVPRIGVLIGALAVLVGLVGCGPQAPAAGSLETPATTASSTARPSKPTTGPSHTHSPTPTGSPSSTDQVRATGSTGSTAPEGPAADAVTAFMHRFVTVDNRATRTGDYSVRDTLVTKSCQICTDSRSYTKKIYDAGGKIVGSLFTHPKIRVFGAQRGQYFVSMDTTVSRYKSYGGDGTVVDSGPAEHQVYSYVVTKGSGGHWQIVGGGVRK